MSAVTSRERVEATLAGEVADHPPVSLWRHWPGDDQDGGALAESTLGFQRQHDFDLVKITPSAAFMAEVWGARTEFRGDAMGVRDYLSRPVTQADHWDAIEEVAPSDAVSLSRELEAAQLVRAALPDDIPVVATLFSPLSVARYLCGEHLFLSQLRMHRAQVVRALGAITATTVRHVRALADAGVDGIYMSAFPASHPVMSQTEYSELATADDVAVLEAASDLSLRILHFHLPHPFLELGRGYPANMVSWEHTRGGPSISEGMALTGRPVLGGLDQFGVLSNGSPDEVTREVGALLEETGPRGLMVSSSCSVPIPTPRGNIEALTAAVRAVAVPSRV